MNKNKKIAFFTPDMYEDSNALWQGIKDEAKEKNINLITLECGRFSSKKNEDINKLKLFNHFNKDYFDGVILQGSDLFTFSNQEEILKVIDTYFKPLPIVSLQFPIENYPMIFYEDYEAAKFLMQHLINVHKYKKIAFLMGPENHIGAQSKFQAYKDALINNNMPVNEKLISKPGPWLNRGKEFISELIDAKNLIPNKNFDALMTVNAQTAKEVIMELQARGIKVPKEVAVVCFNDDEEAKCINPPLTTATPPFYKLGIKSVQLLMQMINGEKVPEKTIMSLDIIIRNSCGCIDEKISNLFSNNSTDKEELSIDDKETLINHIINKCVDIIKNSLGRIKILFFKIFDQLINDADENFYYNIHELIYEILLIENDNISLENAIKIFHSTLIELINIDECVKLNKIIINITIIINEISFKIDYNKNLQVNLKYQALNKIQNSLIANYDIKHLINILKNDLKNFGIDGTILYLYKNLNRTDNYCETLINYDANFIEEYKFDKYIEANKILNDVYLKKISPYNLIVMSLNFDKDAVGLIIFNSSQINNKIYYSLKDQISSVLKGSLLIEEIEKSKEILFKKNKDLEKLISPMLDLIKYITSSSEDKTFKMKNLEFSAETCYNKIKATNSIIEKVNSNISNMAEMIKTIDEISISIKLLAINASVSSSHAGEYGKVFSVIAKEVRKLSDTTKNNAENISRMLGKIIEDIQGSTKVSLETYNTFNEIKNIINEVFIYLNEINSKMFDLKDKSNSILKIMSK